MTIYKVKKMAEKKQTVREYNIPLRKEFQKAPVYKRANRAVSALRQFLIHHMKSENIIIAGEVNEFIWKRGMKHPPHHVPVTVAVEDSKVLVSLRKQSSKREGKKKLKSDLKLEEIQKKKEEKLKQELEKQEKEKAEAEAKKKAEESESKEDISETVDAEVEKAKEKVEKSTEPQATAKKDTSVKTEKKPAKSKTAKKSAKENEKPAVKVSEESKE